MTTQAIELAATITVGSLWIWDRPEKPEVEVLEVEGSRVSIKTPLSDYPQNWSIEDFGPGRRFYPKPEEEPLHDADQFIADISEAQDAEQWTPEQLAEIAAKNPEEVPINLIGDRCETSAPYHLIGALKSECRGCSTPPEELARIIAEDEAKDAASRVEAEERKAREKAEEAERKEAAKATRKAAKMTEKAPAEALSFGELRAARDAALADADRYAEQMQMLLTGERMALLAKLRSAEEELERFDRLAEELGVAG